MSAGLTCLERLILELALHDVTNGTAERSAESFRRAVEEGADLLGSLGLRYERRGPDDRAPARPLLEQAA